MTTRSLRGGAGALRALSLVAVLTLCGCAAEPSVDAGGSDAEAGSSAVEATPSEAPNTEDEAPTDQETVPPAQKETCDWDAPPISGSTDVPTGQEGELAEVLIGAWQHTHFDTGSGYEATSFDHRYVFPAADRVLYCQHVPGITDHAENATDFVLNGTTIELPGGKYGWVVSAWNADTMVWINRLDDSRFLLHRR